MQSTSKPLAQLRRTIQIRVSDHSWRYNLSNAESMDFEYFYFLHVHKRPATWNTSSSRLWNRWRRQDMSERNATEKYGQRRGISLVKTETILAQDRWDDRWEEGCDSWDEVTASQVILSKRTISMQRTYIKESIGFGRRIWMIELILNKRASLLKF